MAEFSVSCVIQNNRDNFLWKLVIVYGSSYDDKKIFFLMNCMVFYLFGNDLLAGGTLT
jgi:hypothetical protein